MSKVAWATGEPDDVTTTAAPAAGFDHNEDAWRPSGNETRY